MKFSKTSLALISQMLGGVTISPRAPDFDESYEQLTRLKRELAAAEGELATEELDADPG